MTNTADGPDFSRLFPKPQEIVYPGGQTELSSDVRLVTSNVLPLQRKGMRGILTVAGVRVVANKKKFIIEATVLEPDAMDFSGVPEAAREEFYELELRDNRVFIRTAGQAGALWATQTLTAIYREAGAGSIIPNMIVRDWPVLPSRGLFVESKWGPDRMDLADWCSAIDQLAALKLNRLGIGLYGCWGNCRFDGQPAEFLMVPVPDRPELKSEKHLRWYSPKDEEWCDLTYLPDMYEFDFLADIVNYGSEKGVTVIPFVNSLGHNTLLPRLLPELSAKAPDGTPLGCGYCLSSEKTREFLADFYGSIIERYFPAGAEYFHVELDEILPDNPDPADPNLKVDPWCQCPECSGKPREERLQDYIVWLVGMLVGKGVDKVVMWNDQLTRHMDALDDTLVAKLAAAGVSDRLILHWWWYANDRIDDRVQVATGVEKGFPGWTAPMACYFNWQKYSVRRENILKMMTMGKEQGAVGAVAYGVYDPGWADHNALIASQGWNYEASSSVDDMTARWAHASFGDRDANCLEGLAALEKAVAARPALDACYHYTYTYSRPDTPLPRDYPGEALTRMVALGVDTAKEQLAGAGAEAEKARATFAALVGDEDLAKPAQDCAGSLLGEAARIVGLASAFGYLLDVWQAVSAGGDIAAARAGHDPARAALLDAMSTVEGAKPDWVVPAVLQSPSVLLAFLDQLKGDLDEFAKESAPGAVRWALAPCPATDSASE